MDGRCALLGCHTGDTVACPESASAVVVVLEVRIIKNNIINLSHMQTQVVLQSLGKMKMELYEDPDKDIDERIKKLRQVRGMERRARDAFVSYSLLPFDRRLIGTVLHIVIIDRCLLASCLLAHMTQLPLVMPANANQRTTSRAG